MVAAARPRTGLLMVAWTTSVAALLLWLVLTPNDAVRAQLRHAQFWAVGLDLLLASVLACAGAPAFLRTLPIRSRHLWVALAAAALSVALTTKVAPQTNRIFYDEQIYQGVAQNLAESRLSQICNDGDAESGRLQCRVGEYSKEPYGYPVILNVAYRLFGVNERTAFVLNPLFAALLVLVVFLATTALTGSASAGGFAALIMALMPEQLRWAHTASAETSAALACASAVLAALAFVRMRSTRSLFCMVSASAVAIQFRPECVLIVPLVLGILLLLAPDTFGEERFWWAGLLGLALSAVHIGHLVAVRGEGWGASGSRFSPAYVLFNLRTNGWFYLADLRFPVAYTALAVAAAVFFRRRRELAVCALYVSVFWGIFLLFYAGSYNYGSDERFSLMTFPPLAMLAGIGAWQIAERPAVRGLSWAAPALAVALSLQFLVYVPFVRAVGDEGWAARGDVAFARDFAGGLPAGSIVLTHNPHMFHLWGRNAAQASLLSTDPAFKGALAARYPGGVYLHWNFWCNVPDPLQHSFCTKALDAFPHVLEQERQVRNYRYAFYRLDVGTSSLPGQ
jgi:hypothetical protein